MVLGIATGSHEVSAGSIVWLFLQEAIGGAACGLAIGALALSLPAGEARDALVTVTYIVVAFSIVVQGLSIGRLVQHALPRPETHP